MSESPAPAACTLWCRTCRKDFVAIGQKRHEASHTPASETVFCPNCRASRKMMLEPGVDGPVTAVYTLEAWAKERGTPPDKGDTPTD